MHRLEELADGFEGAHALVRLFGGKDRLRRFLSKVEVKVDSFRGYMWVDDEERCLVVSREYLQRAEGVLLYLDLVHEIVHLWQLSQGRELFDERYPYDQRPTELEAYRITVDEARRLGLSDEFVREYLKVDWITEEQHRRLLQALGLASRPGEATP
jgi:hypothetical protein